MSGLFELREFPRLLSVSQNKSREHTVVEETGLKKVPEKHLE